MKMGGPKTKSTAICGARLVWLALVLERLVRGLQGAPALYMFGDSQLDVGNNNYVPAGVAGVFKANHPRYGVDYPGGVATGRFSNGRNLADFIADTLGAPSPPAYRSIANTTGNSTSIFLKGVNFAYGGARVSEHRNLRLLSGASNNLGQQIERDYSSVRAQLVRQLGETRATAHLADSIFVIAIGSTDIMEHALLGVVDHSGSLDDESPDDLVQRLGRAFECHLKRLYLEGGMRNVLVVGTGPLGYYPALRLLRERESNGTTRCSQECQDVNEIPARYNTMVRFLLQSYASGSGWDDLRYSFVHQDTVLQEYIRKPAANGYMLMWKRRAVTILARHQSSLYATDAARCVPTGGTTCSGISSISRRSPRRSSRQHTRR